MKNLYIIFIALLLASGAMAQTKQPCSTCLPEGIIFTTQAQIDSFPMNYPNCNEIDGYVTISGDNIINLDSLINVTQIGGFLEIGYAFMKPDDGWVCAGNPNLMNIQGLQNLTIVGGFLQIFGNSVLTELTGLESLTTIGGSLFIGAILPQGWGVLPCGNAIEDLTALSNLESINGELIIESNSLSSLEGLNNIDTSTITYLRIFGNSNLSHCEIQNICDYLNAANGNAYIGYNASGCDSEQEVVEACESTDVNEYPLTQDMDIFPNPSSTNTIAIELPSTTTPQKNTTLTIFNINGQVISQRQITEPLINMDISGLSQGVYFVKVVSNDGVSVEKFVKQ